MAERGRRQNRGGGGTGEEVELGRRWNWGGGGTGEEVEPGREEVGASAPPILELGASPSPQYWMLCNGTSFQYTL